MQKESTAPQGHLLITGDVHGTRQEQYPGGDAQPKHPGGKANHGTFQGSGTQVQRELSPLRQNNRVNPAADSRGISSAQNRQIAPLEESGKGISPVSTAQPRKKASAFPVVVKNFFKMCFLLCV